MRTCLMTDSLLRSLDSVLESVLDSGRKMVHLHLHGAKETCVLYGKLSMGVSVWLASRARQSSREALQGCPGDLLPLHDSWQS
jgi:hypothetical protein